MLRNLKDFVSNALRDGNAPDGNREHALQLATAALLIEIAQADYDEGNQLEDKLIRQLLQTHFELTESETDDLFDLAHQEAQKTVSLHDFTRQLHGELSVEEKSRILEMLWRVAYADKSLDKYEDHLVRKIADLLYIPHGEIIRIRNRVQEQQH